MAALTYPIDMIAKLLDLTPRRVQQLTAEGVLPKAERGKYELVPCVRGYIRYLRDRAVAGDVGAEQYSQHRARLTKSRADYAELETQRLAGQLIPAPDVEKAWGALVSVCRQRLLAIGAKVAPRMKVLASEAEYKDAIDAEVHAALAELSSADLVFDPPPLPADASVAAGADDDAEEVRASDQDDGEPVG